MEVPDMPNRTCSVTDCQHPTKAYGYCQNHYRKWRKYGDPLASFPSALERFHSRYVTDDVTGCMIWAAARSDTGYGQLGVDGRVVYVHRWSYEQFVGPIPDGLVIDHLCRNRACCNPAHLRACTDRENVLEERSLSNSAANARKTHCDYGHPFDDANTYIRPDTGARQCRACNHRRQVARSKHR